MAAEHGTGLDAYVGLVERSKLELALSRIRAWGFPRHEWDDLLQTLAIHIAAFRYDPGKSNGAKESTALCALVNRQLAKAARAKKRQAELLERYKAELGAVDGAGEEVLSYRENVALQLDVRQAVNALPDREQTVCRAILAGEKPGRIARRLRCSRETVNRCMRRIRKVFEPLGLREWIHGARTEKQSDVRASRKRVRN